MGYIIKNMEKKSYIVSTNKGVSYTTDLNKAYQWKKKKSAVNVRKTLMKDKKNSSEVFSVIEAEQEARDKIEDLFTEIKRQEMIKKGIQPSQDENEDNKDNEIKTMSCTELETDNNEECHLTQQADFNSETQPENLSTENPGLNIFEKIYNGVNSNKITNNTPGILNTELYSNACKIIDYIENLSWKYEDLKRELKNTDIETQDFLHIIEFCNLNKEKELELYKQLKELRIRRRNCKDQIALIEQLIQLIPNDKKLAELKKTFTYMSTRNYSLRIRKDLVDFINQP